MAKKANLMCYLKEVDDPRKPSSGTLHDLVEILVIAMVVVLSDHDSVENTAYWAYQKEGWLRRFQPLTNGVPSEKTFLRIFRALDPKQFEGQRSAGVAGPDLFREPGRMAAMPTTADAHGAFPQ